MKKFIIILTVFIGCIALAFTFQQNVLLGRWESKMPGKSTGGVIYKADHTYQAYVNKKVFITGNYDLKKDTLSMSDNGCPVKGFYKITFFADSIRYNVIADSCTGRKHDVDKAVLGRVKSTQNLSN